MRIGFRAVSVLMLAGLAGCGQKDTGEALAAPRSVLYERAMALLQVQFQSKDASVRANCVEAMEPVLDPRADEIVEAGLHDPEPVVRFSAAMTCGKRKTVGVKPVLEKMANYDQNESVRVAAIYALSAMGDTANMSVLWTTLNSKSAGARANTAMVLGLMKNESAIDILQNRAAVEVDPRVKFEITGALARLGDKGAMEVIIALALSKYAEDEYNAMTVCADLPPTAAAPLLQGLDGAPGAPAAVQDLTTRRQLVAARALGKRGSNQGLRIAEANLKNPSADLRALAALALGEILRGTGPRVLVPLLSDEDVGVQRAAAAAILNVSSREQEK